MIEFINNQAELTTAATDLLLGCVALWCAKSLPKPQHARYRTLWRAIFLLLALAAVLGAVAHGLVISKPVYEGLWAVIYLALALLVAAFLVVFVWDLFGPARARQIMGPAVLLGGGFFAYTLLFPSSFLPFVIYQVSVMLCALAGYSWLAVQVGRAGAGWLALGIAITIVASAVQATKALSFTLVWAFDHNGVYHLIQTVGLWVLLYGYSKAVNAPASP
ncbi:hypothetical protein L1F30_13455 [Simiduia sp. 21SJ11W-1]|uniref:DUF6962 family protein n=1 Tax=Simiduia sp. 21SJ11W-1 TaxID=2909669 RepID=UPI0020A0FCD1|nr:hypothetical protein [Simiduia sp. 21SJ11W-1]UTA47164.1 hypothetical protein L1F30_13455 [Simiduia sp. 21SJ11W-1]